MKGGYLREPVKPRDLKGNALPEELLRCYEETYTDENGVENTRKISLMLRREVPQFDTPFFNRCLEIYNNWKLFKQSPPSGAGWANERNTICQILQIIERENVEYEAWLNEKERASRSKR